MAETVAVPIADLEPYPGNPRRGNVQAIVESLEAHGQFRPIVVQASTNYILAGNHTVQAAQQLGWTEIDAWVLDVDDDDAKRILLADNRTSDLGFYDDGDLLGLLSALEGDLIGTGYDTDDLTDLRHLTDIRDLTAGGLDSHYDGAALSADGVIPDKGLQALADDYAAKAVRSVILAYSLEDFDEVTRLMATAREAYGSDSNADAILQVLRAR